MPDQNNSELFGFLVKELIDRITSTQEQLTAIAKDHEKRITTIELAQQQDEKDIERGGRHAERVWAILFALSSIIYTALYLLELLRIFPNK